MQESLKPPPAKTSPLRELCSALPSLPLRLQQVGRFVAANDYDATTRSMRDLAAEAGALGLELVGDERDIGVRAVTAALGAAGER